jgi:ATP-binding cassette subfamily C protein EexD
MSRKTPIPELRAALASFAGSFAYVGLFSLFINLLMLVPSLYMLQVYDRVMASRSESTLLMLTLIVVLLFITMGLLEFVRSRMLIRIGTQLDEKLNDRLFNAMFKASLRHPSQTHAQALDDLNQIRQFLTGPALFAFFDAPWVPIYIGVLFLFHPLYGSFAVVAAVLLFGLALANEFATKQPLAAANAGAIASRSLVASESRNAEVVHAMGMLGRLRERWMQKHRGYLALQALASDRASVWSNMSKSTRMMLQSLMLGLGGYLAIQFEVTSGMIVAGSIVLGRALAPLDQLIGGWKQFGAARSGYARLQKLLEEVPPEEENMPLPAPQGHLLVDNLVLIPPTGGPPVLRGISFQLNKGEALGLVGPSGAGKSSLARAILGVWPLAAGKSRLDGADIARWNRDDLGPSVGYLPQDIELFAGTIADNIARFGALDAERIVAAAKRAGVHEMILQRPNGYDTQIGPGGATLSGGQRQRIGLARAVYGDPKLVVLDEPNSNLDDAGEAALMSALDALRQLGATVLLISHRPNILMKMDKILVLRDGVVALLGTRNEVLPKLLGHAAQPVPELGTATPIRSKAQVKAPQPTA